MKRKAKVKKSNINSLYLDFIFRSFPCINCAGSVLIVQNTRRRNIINRLVHP